MSHFLGLYSVMGLLMCNQHEPVVSCLACFNSRVKSEEMIGACWVIVVWVYVVAGICLGFFCGTPFQKVFLDDMLTDENRHL